MALPPEVCKKVLTNYRFGEVLSIERLSSGFTNHNYKIATSKELIILRFFKEQSLEDIKYEIKLLGRLRKKGYPAAYPLPDRQKRYIQESSLGYAAVYQFIEGEEPEASKNITKEIARSMAKLHVIKGWKSLLRHNPHNFSRSKALVKKFKKAKYQYPELFDFVRKETALLKEPLSIEIPMGFIHGDLYKDNTLFQGKKLQAIIDFECACTDKFLIDIGIAINGFCFNDNQLDQKRCEQMVKEYQKIRPLTKKEIKLLPYYIRWGSFVWVCWHLEMALDKKAPANLERARYLMERIEGLGL